MISHLFPSKLKLLQSWHMSSNLLDFTIFRIDGFLSRFTNYCIPQCQKYANLVAKRKITRAAEKWDRSRRHACENYTWRWQGSAPNSSRHHHTRSTRPTARCIPPKGRFLTISGNIDASTLIYNITLFSLSQQSSMSKVGQYSLYKYLSFSTVVTF